MSLNLPHTYICLCLIIIGSISIILIRFSSQSITMEVSEGNKGWMITLQCLGKNC